MSKVNSVIKLYELFGSSISLEHIRCVTEKNKYDTELSASELLETHYNKAGLSDAYVHLMEKNKRIENVIENIRNGFKLLVILRGLPGSGKSTLARKILDLTFSDASYEHILSTDDFFILDGNYKYNKDRLKEAHVWNQKRCLQKLMSSLSPVIIDNTNIKMWEMEPYAKLAVDHGYIIEILEPDTDWSFNSKQLYERNVHNLPEEKIVEMLHKYDRNVSATTLLSTFNLLDKYSTIPNLRKLPVLQKCTKLPSVQAANEFKMETINLNRADVVEQLPSTVYSTLEGNSLEYLHNPNNNNNMCNLNIVLGIDKEAKENIEFATLLPPCDKTIGFTNLMLEENKNDKMFKKEAGCNTDINDFNVLNGDELLPLGYSLLYGKNIPMKYLPLEGFTRKSGTFDKSSSTNEIERNRQFDLEKLAELFSSVPYKYIIDMYDKCNENFDMTVEIFLEDNKEYTNCSTFSADNLSNRRKSFVISRDYDNRLSSKGILQNKILRINTNELCFLDQEMPTCPTLSNNNSLQVSSIDFDSNKNFEDGSENHGDSTETLVELNLGECLVEQLEENFRKISRQLPRGFQPIVQIPKSLAKQIYTFYIESVYQQMDAQKAILDSLTKEDEIFVKKNQEHEVSENLFVQHLENCNEKSDTPFEKLIKKLARKKLAKMFKNIDPIQLEQVFCANNYNYEDTLADLCNSVDYRDNEIKLTLCLNPLIEPNVKEELEQAYKTNFFVKEFDENEPAEYYRNKAKEYLERRQELYQKAKNWCDAGETEIAHFFFELAKKNTFFFDRCNHLAASKFLEKHSLLQNFDTLDLHFLYVKEAVEALDVFIDKNINFLKGCSKKSQNLLLITGRGNRSKSGCAKIKPAVESRLKVRKIWFVELNPGLLKIKITRTCTLTSDL